MVAALSCADSSKDPFRLKELKKATILALRDKADTILVDGSAEYAFSFFRDKIDRNYVVKYKAELLATDFNSLKSIDIYARRYTGKGSEPANEPIKTIPFSEFAFEEGYVGPIVNVSLPLTDILKALKIPDEDGPAADSLEAHYLNGISFWTDLNLVDGSIVKAEYTAAAGLKASYQFYPAQQLVIGVYESGDYLPVASVSRVSKLPLSIVDKHSVDTLKIVFSEAISVLPTLSASPDKLCEFSRVKRVAKDELLGLDTVIVNKENDTIGLVYLIKVISGDYTGNLAFKVSGAVSKEFKFQQSAKSFNVPIDNTEPSVESVKAQLVSTSGTPARVGKDQAIRLTIRFIEAMNTGSVDNFPVLKFVIGNAKISAIPDATTTVVSGSSTDFTYVYSFKSNLDLNKPENQTTDKVTITVTGGQDLAGNNFDGVLPAEVSFLVDLSIPLAPIPTLSSPFDFANTLKWSFTQDAVVVGASTTGTIYWVAVVAGSLGPDSFEITDTGPSFTRKNTKGDGGKKFSVAQNGESKGISISGGSTGVVYSPFVANGKFDIYSVFVSDMGNVSPVPVTPSVKDVEMKVN